MWYLPFPMRKELVSSKNFSCKCHTKPNEELEIYYCFGSGLLRIIWEFLLRRIETMSFHMSYWIGVLVVGFKEYWKIPIFFVLFLNPSLSVKFLVVVTLFMAGMAKLPLKTNWKQLEVIVPSVKTHSKSQPCFTANTFFVNNV